MRVLFISTFYPPHIIGGWEQLVQEINEHLKSRGHETQVLTSTHGVGKPIQENGVARLLTLEADLHHYKPGQILSYKRQVEDNLARTQEMVDTFDPDVIFIHIMWNLSRGIAWLAEQLRPGRVVYYMADHWPYAPDPHTAYWQDPARNLVMKVSKQLLAPVSMKIVEQTNKDFKLKFERVLCVSQAIRDDLGENTNIPVENMHVVYNGIDTDYFIPAQSKNGHKKGLSLLYAGSLIWHKGVHTAVEAMAILAQQNKLSDVTLTIVGSGHPDYEAKLKSMVEEAGLQTVVNFYGRVPREEMPEILKQFDVLIFPSTWEEPLARMTQEAMATKLVVIGTTTGGTKEILIDNETGLTFPPENATALAKRIEQLINQPELVTTLAQNARREVVRRFDIRRMIDEIETHLNQVTDRNS